MVIRVLFIILFSITGFIALAQTSNLGNDSSINNLVLPKGYITGKYGDVPEYIKSGKGKKEMILIPGLGFDASVFNDFMEANKENYTMYAITIPGFGNTAAPPMPDTGTSYGAQTWHKSVVEGLSKLIKKEKLNKPVIVGHFVNGVQIAIRMALANPDKTGGLVLIGGPAKFIGVIDGKIYDSPEDKLIQIADKYSAPVWFKGMKKEFFDDGNYLPEIYSLNEETGKALWKNPANVALPVMVRYLCEFIAQDITKNIADIKCPVLVLRPTFNETVLNHPVNNYVKPQFIDTWNKVTAINPNIVLKDIPGSASFAWKDNPNEVFASIKEFIFQYNLTAEQIISNHIKAIGGIENITKLRSIYASGEVETTNAGKMKIDMWMLQNKGFRSDITRNDTIRSSVLYDHYRWQETIPGKKSTPQKMTDDAWASIDLDLAGEIADYAKKGNSAEYTGIESVDGKDCFKIKITAKTGKTTYYFIDMKTYFILQSTVFHIENGKETDDGTSKFDDYRKTGSGTIQPFLLKQVVNGKIVGTTRITKMEVNKSFDKNVFEMPQN